MTNNMSLAEALDRIADATANHIRITDSAKRNPGFAFNLLSARMMDRIVAHSEEPDPEVGEFIDLLDNTGGPLIIRAIREAADRKITLLSGYGDSF